MKINEQLIENYLLNKLSESERTSFEALVDSNPQFKSEVLFDKAVVSGIQTYRKEALKNRLNNIPVNTSPFSLSTSALFTKVALTTLTLFTACVGVYLYNKSLSLPPINGVTNKSKEIIVDSPNNVELDINLNFSKIFEEINSIDEINESLVKLESVKTISSNKKSFKESSKDFKEEVNKVKVFNPNAAIPSISEVSEENGGLVDVKLEDIEAVNVSSNKQVKVETHITKKLDLKYKYYDRKLLLDGAFDKGTYKILEINGINDKSLYIKYLGSFYYITPTDKLSELPKVTDKYLIKELELLDKDSLPN